MELFADIVQTVVDVADYFEIVGVNVYHLETVPKCKTNGCSTRAGCGGLSGGLGYSCLAASCHSNRMTSEKIVINVHHEQKK